MFVSVFKGTVSFFSGWKLSGRSKDVDVMAEEQIQNLMKKKVISDCFAFFCMSLYKYLYVP
jgi:hypothetical protein